MSEAEHPEFVTVSQAAKILGLSSVRVRHLCTEGRLGFRVGTYWLIRRSELKEFADIPRPVGRPIGGSLE